MVIFSKMSDIGKAVTVLRRALRGKEISWPNRMLLNHRFADKMLPTICEHYGSKRIHAFRMVIERVLSKEPLVYFERELADELLKLMRKAGKVADLVLEMQHLVARQTAAEAVMAPST